MQDMQAEHQADPHRVMVVLGGTYIVSRAMANSHIHPIL